jgi:hypothetical protein
VNLCAHDASPFKACSTGCSYHMIAIYGCPCFCMLPMCFFHSRQLLPALPVKPGPGYSTVKMFRVPEASGCNVLLDTCRVAMHKIVPSKELVSAAGS